MTILYIPHGGGPLPLMDHEGHRMLVQFLKTIPERIRTPDAIVTISAHWEQSVPALTAGTTPPLVYDYSGFPARAYDIEYPAPGAPGLAQTLLSSLSAGGIQGRLEKGWGFDHGMFIPLKLMYPEANIPCVQLSLVNGLDPGLHLKMGRALTPLTGENILVLGSGFSFHNMGAFGQTGQDLKNIEFDRWLIETMTASELAEQERRNRLLHWEQAPHARYCHPREEHLMPLHVCYGITEKKARLVFNDAVMGKKASAFLWSD